MAITLTRKTRVEARFLVEEGLRTDGLFVYAQRDADQRSYCWAPDLSGHLAAEVPVGGWRFTLRAGDLEQPLGEALVDASEPFDLGTIDLRGKLWWTTVEVVDENGHKIDALIDLDVHSIDPVTGRPRAEDPVPNPPFGRREYRHGGPSVDDAFPPPWIFHRAPTIDFEVRAEGRRTEVMRGVHGAQRVTLLPQ